MTNTPLQEVTDATFDELVIQNEGWVLVDFSASWCGPCKTMMPVLERYADDHADKITLYKLDIDSSPDSPKRFQVRGVPTLLLFHAGEQVGVLVGAVSASALDTFVNEHIEKVD